MKNEDREIYKLTEQAKARALREERKDRATPKTVRGEPDGSAA